MSEIEALAKHLSRIEEKVDLQNILQREVHDIKQAKIYTSLSISRLHFLKEAGKIKAYQPNGKGGKIYFRKADLDAYMLSNPTETTEEITNKTEELARQAADYVNLNPIQHGRGKKKN